MIRLDCARLSNVPGRPCIDLGENSDVTLDLIGNSRFESCGIRVPSSARLRVLGKGSVEINLTGTDYYGVGNDMESEHGELVFEQDGTISITSDSHSGVCIGSGLGGVINIDRGRYVLRSLGSMGVCIGAFYGDTKVNITGCDIDAAASGAHCTVIGSIDGEADISAHYSSIKCKAGSIRAAALGTVTGARASVSAESVSIVIEMNAEGATAFGALDNNSEIDLSRSSVTIKSDGKNVLAFGGTYGRTIFSLKDLELNAAFSSELHKCFYADESDISVNGGKYHITINGTEQESLF